MNTTTQLPYQMTVAWQPQDAAWLAAVPALKGCIAYGDSPEEAVAEAATAAALWLEAAAAHGKPIPRADIHLERLAALAPVLNLSAVARQARIPIQTIASKLQRGTPLTEKQAQALGQVLAGHGIE